MKNATPFISLIALATSLFVSTSVSALDTIDNGQEVITIPTSPEEQAQWQAAYEAEKARAAAQRATQPARQANPVSYQQRNTQPQAAPEAGELFDAATSGNIQLIGQLLSQGLDINVSNAERETALHMAAARGQYRAVIFLIKNGAYVNAKTVKNWIPLHHATRFNHPNIVNYLLKHNSSAHARTSDGLSAIDMASNVNDRRLLSILGAR